MTAGTSRILPFLGASVAVHVIAIGALGTEPLSIATSPDGTGSSVSVRLEAAGAAPGEPALEPPRAPAGGDSPAAEPAASTTVPRPDNGPPRAVEAPEQHPEPGTRQAVTDTDRGGAAHAERTDSDAAPPRDGPAKSTATSRTQARRAERVASVDHFNRGAASTSSRVSRSEAREALVAELARYFTYPRLAVRQGWEGTVVLSVRILPDGRLDEIRVKESSGRALLDRSAAASLGHVERLPGFADRVGDGGLALEIPVSYRLESA